MFATCSKSVYIGALFYNALTMRNLILSIVTIVFCLGLSSGVSAQIDTAYIYKNARFVARVNAKKVETLASALAKPCVSDEEKVLAFSYWICKNIKLDYAEYEKRPAENKTLKKILRSRKALSDGYVKLFVEMCKTQKIPAVYVPGYSRDFDCLPGDTLVRTEYAWALVQLSDSWYIMDLANASCKVVSVVAPFANVFWTLFRIPYASHLKAIKEYNPRYLYISPQKSLHTLMPAADLFQLMKFPMSMSYFIAGDSAVTAYLERNPDELSNSSFVSDFANLSATEKYVYVAEKSEEANPANQYTKALYYYFALKNFFNTYYLEEKGKIFAPLDETKKAWNYSNIADSLFYIATQNNAKEFDAKQKRSENWKTHLIESNKMLSQKISTQSKVNSQQVRALGKINSQNKKIQSYIAKNNGKYALRDIIDLSRPMIQNKEYLEQGTALINDVYDKMDRCKSLLADFDSLIAPLENRNIDTIYSQQQNASDLCNKELLSLSRYLDKKGSNLSLVYFSDKYVFKKGFFDVFEVVGDINETYTDPTIELMTERIPVLFDILQNYVNENLAAFKMLKSAKVLLSNDYGEDDLYEKMALRMNAQLNRISKQIEDITKFDDNMSTCLSGDVTLYKDMVKMLQNDNSMENYRHKEYMDYRKSIKQAENDKVKYYQGTIKNYQKLIGKAL